MEVLELYMTGYQEARLKPTEATLKVGWPLKVASGNNQKATRKTGYDLKGTQLHMNFTQTKKKNPKQNRQKLTTASFLIGNIRFIYTRTTLVLVSLQRTQVKFPAPIKTATTAYYNSSSRHPLLVSTGTHIHVAYTYKDKHTYA